MSASPDFLALIALLTPAAVFLLLAILAPLRRSGRPAAFLSIAGALTSFAAAVTAWRSFGESSEAITRVWAWLPQGDGVLASVGVLADPQSTVMLVLVTLVALLVQTYSLGYLSEEPPAALGRY